MRPREIAHYIRGVVSRAVVRGTSDSGETQTANVTTHANVHRNGIEIVQPFGLASRPRAGGLMVVLAVGGDQGDLVGLPVSVPADRFGGLDEGETAIYAADGSRVHIRADGSIEVLAQTKLTATVGGGAQIEVTPEAVKTTVGGTSLTQTASGWDFQGGSITHNGVPIDDGHIHDGVVPGGGTSGTPVG